MGVVAHEQPVGPRLRVGPADYHVASYQRALEAMIEPADLRVLEHDRVLDLRMVDLASVRDRAVRADVSVSEHRARADRRGPAHLAALEPRPRPHRDATLDLGVHQLAFHLRLDRVE